MVHTAWGPADRWSELGAHDAWSQQVLGARARAPVYAFANEGSQRQDILGSLLHLRSSEDVSNLDEFGTRAQEEAA